jgi:hypothetical protein
MPPPKIWENANVLIADLSQRIVQSNALVLRPIDTPADWKRSIRNAVSGNTFRAFPKQKSPTAKTQQPQHPSQVFRDWAFDALITRGYFKELKRVQSRVGYDDWLEKLVRDFRLHWKRKMLYSIPFGPSYKLPNLLMKVVCYRLPPSQCQRVLKYLHVPLDSYTLVGIRECMKLPDGRRIPTTATMNFVKGKKVYWAVQKRIRELAKSAGVVPIAYDHLAWGT